MNAVRLGVNPKCMKRLHYILSISAVIFLAGCAAISRSERDTLMQHNVSPVVYDRMIRGEILTLSDIIELSQRQVSPQLVIRYLYWTRAIYNLDKQSITRLNQGKVSQEIIDYLLDTPTLFTPQFYPSPYVGPRWYPHDAYYPYYPYGPNFYGSSTLIIEGERRHRW